MILAASAVIGSVLGFEFTTPPEGRMDDDGKYITSNAPYTYVLGSLMEIEWTYTPVMDGLVFTLELYYKDNSIGSFAKAGTLFSKLARRSEN